MAVTTFGECISALANGQDRLHLWNPSYETHLEPLEGNYDDFLQGRPHALRLLGTAETDPPRWSLANFAGRVGWNGWRPQDGLADFVVFESDHGHGSNAQTPEQMAANDARLKGKASIYHSTGGKGRHYFVDVVDSHGQPVSVTSRSDYNNLCVFVCDALGMSDKTCAKGGFLWGWTREPKADSFRLVSEQAEPFTVPDDWRSHLPQRTLRVKGQPVELSPDHDNVLNWLIDHGHPCEPGQFDDGSEFYRVNAYGLKLAHEALHLRGVFQTVSDGTNPDRFNCYMTPTEFGGWSVHRYGDVAEPGWNYSERTRHYWCHFNQFTGADWRALCQHFQGVHKRGRSKATFVFGAVEAASVLRASGAECDLPFADRDYTILYDEGTITIEVRRQGDEPTPEGWVHDSANTFAKAVNTVESESGEAFDEQIEEVVRIAYHLSESARQNGDTLFFVRHQDGTWKPETKDNVKLVLRHAGLPNKEIDGYIGSQVWNPWKISLRPFTEAEGPRIWNRGYQLAESPAPGDHPTWDMVLGHTGEYLNRYVADDPWCQENNIRTGADYLKVYLAKTVQDPACRLPQLFLFSKEQATGKDTFTDTTALLFERGAVVDATTAVTNQQGFNADIEGAVVYVLNEIDLSRSGSVAESRCREWTTAPTVKIHPKGLTPYAVPNYGRVIQMANDLGFKMVDVEDSRVVVIELAPIPKDAQLDWREELRPALERERAAFLHTLTTYDLPERGARGSRCYLPVLMTDAKLRSIAANLPLLECDRSLLLEICDTPWDGLKEFKEIELEHKPTSPKAWAAAWERITPHLLATGFTPIARPFAKHQHAAAWGFA